MPNLDPKLALVAQGIEHRPPEPGAQVRILPRALLAKLKTAQHRSLGMRTIWKGAISFGLVTIPVTMHKATEDKTPKFRQLRAKDGSPIKYRRVADVDGEEVDKADIVRGFEVEAGRYVVFTDEELAQARVAGGPRLVDVVQFVDKLEIDPIYYKSSFYLAPEQTGEKAYQILSQALAERGSVGIALISIREKQQLATLRTNQGVIVLETMFWPDEIRQPSFERPIGEVEVRPDEVALAGDLIEGMTREFIPDEYQDRTRSNISELVEKKMQGEEILGAPEPELAQVVDLMEALKASVAANRSGKKRPSDKRDALPEPKTAAKPKLAKPAGKAAKPTTRKPAAKKPVSKAKPKTPIRKAS